MRKTEVWDLPVRLFHWSLVVLIILAVYSIQKKVPDLKMHQYIGISILILLLFRIVWGFIGSSTARFWDFIKGPKAIYYYLRYGHSTTEGHNPVGAFMVVFMMIVLLIQVTTGLFLEDNTYLFEDAPLYNHLSEWAFVKPLTGFFVEKPMNTRAFVAWVHAKNLYVIYVMVALHVFALLMYFIFKKQNLVKTMIVGKRSRNELHSPKSESIRHNRPWLALIAFVVIAIAVTFFFYGYLKDISFLTWVKNYLVWLKELVF